MVYYPIIMLFFLLVLIDLLIPYYLHIPYYSHCIVANSKRIRFCTSDMIQVSCDNKSVLSKYSASVPVNVVK